MNLPKRNSEDGRCYWMKPDVQEKLQPLFDQCIQDAIDGKITRPDSLWPPVVVSSEGAPFEVHDLVRKWTEAQQAETLDAEKAIAFSENLRRLSRWGEIDYYLLGLLKRELQEKYFVVTGNEDDHVWNREYSLKPSIRAEQVPEPLLRFACYVAVSYKVYGLDFEYLDTNYLFGLVEKVRPDTAVFWRGGEKIDLNGLEPDAVQRLSVTGERKVDLSFLRDYPNLKELTLMEKCEGVEVLSQLKQLHTLSLWLSAPVSWDDVSLPSLRVLHLRGEKNGDITPLLSSITYLHLEEMRKTEDLTPFLTPATQLQKLYLNSLPAVQVLPKLAGLPALYALKLYELHKLSDLSALSHSHLRYFAASLIADKLSAKALADAVMEIPHLEGAALQLVDRSERRYGGIQKAFAAAGKSPLLREEISALTTWLSL